MDVGHPFSGLGNARQYLEKGALARTIASDDADHFASLDLKRDVSEGPDRVVSRGCLRGLTAQDPAHPLKGRRDSFCDRVAQRSIPLDDFADVVLLA